MDDYYGGEGGGWIEFRGFIWQFGNYGQNINFHYDANMLLGFQRIEYEGEKVKKRIREMILKFHKVGAGNSELVRECIGDCLSRMSLSVKAPIDDHGKDTSLENETRLIYYLPSKKDQGAYGKMSRFRFVDKNHIALPFADCTRRMGVSITVHSNDQSVLDYVKDQGRGECKTLYVNNRTVHRM